MAKVVSVTEVSEWGLSRFGTPIIEISTSGGARFHTEPDNVGLAYEIKRYMRPGDQVEIDLDVYGRITDYRFVE